jgi:hypothetical protein
VPDGNLEGDAGAVTEAENVCLVDTEVSKERRDIICGGLKRTGLLAPFNG